MTTAAPVPTAVAVPAAVPAPATRTLAELRRGQPAPLSLTGARDRIRAMNRDAGQHVVVLDDDPTGSQVVHDLPVLTSWDDDDLRWALAHPARAFFVLTNSRSLPAQQTEELLRDLSARLHRVSAELGTEVVLLSRSDSTLRGHFPLETDVLQQAATERGAPYDAVLLVPAYLDAGRVTVDDVHYARDGVTYVPVGSTDYATDDAFGYTSSSLSQWVQEKTGSRVLASDVLCLRLADIRGGGVERVTQLLLSARDGRVVSVDALDESDLEVVALALGAAERTGWRALCRVGPSFVPVRTGIDRRPPLSPAEIAGDPPRAGHGLVVVGSHVELTTRQVSALLQLPDLEPVELDVDALADPSRTQHETERCASALERAAGRGDVVLMTSRRRVVLQGGESSLELARLVSSTLVSLTRGLVSRHAVSWVVAKGGITSHDVATRGLGIRRATVLGQLFDGVVSLWRNESAPDPDSGLPALEGLPYVVFAGNVGDDQTLAQTILLLRGHSAPDPSAPPAGEIR